MSKCQTLSPSDADKIFFPGRGGKINKADEFCSNCPVLQLCLVNAIANDLEGFYAGTTRQQRRVMHETMPAYQKIVVVDTTVVPEPPKRRRRIFKAFSRYEDPHEWLDKVEGPELVDIM